MAKEQKTKTYDQAAFEAAVEVAKLVISKQHDYGPDNILKCPVGPELGIVVRVSDKLSRLSNLVRKGVDPTNESLVDTANDIMGYGLVLKMLLEGSFTLPLAEDEFTGPCECMTCSGYCACEKPGHHEN